MTQLSDMTQPCIFCEGTAVLFFKADANTPYWLAA